MSKNPNGNTHSNPNVVLKHNSYVSPETLSAHCEDLERIEEAIEQALESYPNFDGIEFFDADPRGIRVGTYHKEISGYYIGEQLILRQDFSNQDEIINSVIEQFKALDNEEFIDNQKRFIEFEESKKQKENI